jgi:hypothetical protein
MSIQTVSMRFARFYHSIQIFAEGADFVILGLALVRDLRIQIKMDPRLFAKANPEDDRGMMSY